MSSRKFYSKIKTSKFSKKKLIKKDFDDKLKNLTKKVTLNKTIHVLVENELNKLKNINKRINKRFDKYSIPDKAKYFSVIL